MGGKTVDCIRVRAVEQRELPAKKPTATAQQPSGGGNDMDDEIPF